MTPNGRQYLPRGRILTAALAERPGNFPVARPRGAKAEGLRYERAVHGALPGAIRGQWFRYEDSEGVHYCQTDVLIAGVNRILIVECKLTWVEDGANALKYLYVPVCETVYGRHALGLVACRRLPREGIPPGIKICANLDDAVQGTLAGKSVVLHWRPNTPIRAAMRSAA